MTVDFGLVIPAGPRKGQIPQWMSTLETVVPQFEGAFKSLWMTDHFFWDDEPTYEAWTVLAYMAAKFPAWHLGPIVLGQSYRNPAMLAKMAGTLQAMTGGRLIMGIGAGWKEDEYRAYGYEYPSAGVRIGQLADTLEIFKRLWTEPGKVTYHGKYYHLQDAWCEPEPDPMIPILVGGGGNTTMKLAAKYADWWNLPDATYAAYAPKVAQLRQSCEAIGRDPKSLKISWFGRLGVAKTEAEALALSGGQWTKDNAFVGTVAQIVDQMRPFIELGVELFMLEPLGLPNDEITGMVREQSFTGITKIVPNHEYEKYENMR